jgi:hypothetical protein
MYRKLQSSSRLAATAVMVVAGTSVASADDVTFTFTKPTGSGVIDMKFEPGPDASADISSTMTATEKRDEIKAKLEAKGYTCTSVGSAGLTVSDLRDGTKVSFIPGPTGEKKDVQTASVADVGDFGFGNVMYTPFDATGQPAVFTGGLITSRGELSAQVSSLELGSPIGPLIAQALFQRLAPQAPAFGAHLSLLGDVIEARFDPNVAHNAGMVYGTTSLTGGLSGSVTLLPEPSALAALAMAPAFPLRRRRNARAA